MSLRTKLWLWYTGIFAVSGCLLTTALYLLIAYRLRGEADRILEDEYAECAAVTLRTLRDPELLETLIRREITGDRYLSVTYRLYDAAARRNVLFVASRAEREALEAATPIAGVPADRAFSSVRLGERRRPYRLLTGPLDPSRHPGLVLQVGMATHQLAGRIVALRTYLVLILVTLLIVAALGGWLLASRSLKPIDEMAADLGRIESSTLSERLNVGPARNEVDRLREAVNRMLERLDEAFGRLESFTADAAHELRTPISALQCRLEVALNRARSVDDYRLAIGDALDQATELGTLIENLLFLARTDRHDGLPSPQRLDLRDLLADLAEPFELLAEQKGVTLTCECVGPLRCEGDPVLLRRLVGNLLDNSVRYTPEGGRVVLRAAAEGQECLVTVADTGIGIAPEALEHIFERFYRADESRSRVAGGAGLGLSIVQRIVQLHGGRIDVQSAPGQGTTVRVWLPLAPPGQPAA